MGFQPTKRVERVVTAADEKSAERRGWLSHGLAALGISALGLAVAASVALTTSAQTTDNTDAPADLPVVAVPANGKAGPAATKKSERQTAALAAYARRDAAVERTSRSAALQVAIVKEQAAQRDEELAKAADEITQAARAATSDARQEKLTEADRASRQAAAQLAQEKVRRAVAARVAASGNREVAESDLDHHPGRQRYPLRRRRCLTRTGRGHRRPLRAVRPLVALPHRSGFPRRVRHPHPSGQGRRGALLGQLRRLGGKPRRDPPR